MHWKKLILPAFIITTGCSPVLNTGRTALNIDNMVIRLTKIDSLNRIDRDFNIQKAFVRIISGEDKNEFLANVKYKKPGVYLVSLKSITGIEAARLFITSDTILVNDRIRKRLLYGSSGYLNEKYGISIKSMQLLFGETLARENEARDTINCENGFAVFTEILNNKRIKYRINCSTGRLTDTFIENNNDQEFLQIKFNWFKKSNQYDIPDIINIKDKSNKLEISIEIERISYDLIDEIDFVPGKNYERVLLK